MYEGRTDMEPGRILGHGNLGEVNEIGPACQIVQGGDRAVLPFNVACGCSENCERGLTGDCLTANPGSAGAAYGFSGMGPYEGGQAEYLRVPWADFNCLVLPADAQEKESNYVMLSDILPTGYHATELAGVEPGESVVIYGAGPVGMMAAYSAMIRGAAQVMVVDTQKDRLALAERIGAIAIDDTEQAGVKRYNRRLCRLIESGKATPSFLVSHELPLAQAPEGYGHFDKREDGWTKVVLKTGA